MLGRSEHLMKFASTMDGSSALELIPIYSSYDLGLAQISIANKRAKQRNLENVFSRGSPNQEMIE